jgi:ubiquinone/menaquinone biosynthesis C-methylase UbiE
MATPPVTRWTAATRLISVLLSLATATWCQVAQEANRDYATQEGRAKMVERLESPARLANLRPAELVARLQIVPASTVVDLGTGTGTLLEALSRAVGSSGRVIAEDIQSDFLERARGQAKKAGLRNVNFVLGTEVDPKLPTASAELVIVLDAYHHFDYPERMLGAIKRSLRPGGRLAIIEYHKKRGAMESADPDFALKHVRAGEEQVVREIEAAGYKLRWLREHAPGRQYIAMFQIP